MVQPYLSSVAEPGEISLVFLDGRYSHEWAARLCQQVTELSSSN